MDSLIAMKMVIVLVALMGGCYYSGLPAFDPAAIVEVANSDAAVDVVMGRFGISPSDRPRIVWVGPAGNDCDDGIGFVYEGECYLGATFDDGIAVAVWRDDMKPSETSLAHELAHWRWGDGGHTDNAIWGHIPGAIIWEGPGTAVGDATQALAAAGL